MKIFKDIIINITSTALPIFLLQFLIFPQLSLEMGKENFGEMVFIISIMTVIGFPLGNTLNNVKLLDSRNSKVTKESDYGKLLLVGILINILMIFILRVFFVDFNMILILIITILMLIKEFLLVEYRIKIDFKGIFFVNVFLMLGYIAGYLLFKKTLIWESIYILGFFSSLLYVLFTANIKRNFLFKSPKSEFFFSRLKNYLTLYFSNLLKNILNHADKLLVFPLLGSVATGTYYVASILGKVINMVITPLNTVVLSYLVKRDRFRLKELNIILACSLIIGIISYIILMFVMKKILLFIYPNFYTDVYPILKYTIATSVIMSIITITNSYNLRFNKLIYQIWLNVINLIVYFIVVPILTYYYNLEGYVIGILVVNILNLILSITLLFRVVSIESEENLK